MAAILSGCAFTYTDKVGDRHTIGLVDITIRAPADPATIAGNVVEVTTLGISVGQTAQGGYLTAGYNHEVTAAFHDDVLVLGNPVTAIAAAPKNEVPQ